MSFAIEPLSREHDRATFDSGEPALDDFLHRHARQNQEKNVSRTYVAVRSGERKVLGFYTLASGAVHFEHLPEDVRRRLPRYPVPVVHLARLAVDRSVRGLRLGEFLLLDALRRAARVADEMGVFAVEVTAKHERAREFYLRYGFRPFVDERLRLYLPIETLRRIG